MLAEEQRRRQSALEKEIFQLSVVLLQDEDTRHTTLRLLEIYKGDFRHSYSDFFLLFLKSQRMIMTIIWSFYQKTWRV